jgi:hypothetical protein
MTQRNTLLATRNIIVNSDLYRKKLPHVLAIVHELDALLAFKPKKKPAKCPLYLCPDCHEPDVTLTAEQSFMANTLEHYCFSVKIQDANAQARCIKCGWTGEHSELTNYQAVKDWHNTAR